MRTRRDISTSSLDWKLEQVYASTAVALTNADKFRLALEAVNRGDIDATLENVDSAVAWEPPGILPDAQIYHGHDGVRAWWDTMNEAFEDLRMDPEGDFKELDDIHVLVPVRASGRGRHSGIEVDVSFYMLGTGRELLERMEFFPNEEEALRAIAARSGEGP
jgi:ketosteroid isomerase-like protein